MNNDGRLRAVVVDHHPITRMGIILALNSCEDISVVGQAERGDEAVRLCEQLSPDVVVMDLDVPGLDGLSTTRMIRQQFPGTQVLILSYRSEPGQVREAIRAGAAGYLTKDVAVTELARGVRATQNGDIVLARSATSALTGFHDERAVRLESLTARQRDVLTLVACGYTNSEIADRLCLGSSTVRFQVSSLLAKLGARNRTEAAVVAMKHYGNP